MVDCRKCKNLFLKPTSEYTSIHACKLGMLKEIPVGLVEMPITCSGFEEIEGNKIDKLKQQREENFKKLGQYMLQKQYYENEITNLLDIQEKLCNKIFKLERGE